MQSWNKDEEDFLQENYNKYSGYQLETEMWIRFKKEITRSAIIGKANRMGLGKDRFAKPSTKRTHAYKQKTVVTHTKTLGDADNKTCMFTTDDPSKGIDMGICGLPVHKHSHCERCYGVVCQGSGL